MAMPKGRSGNPAGRPKGSVNKVTKLRMELLAKIVKDKKTPLDFMLGIMTSKEIPLALRMDAAKAAAPFVHKRMPQAVQLGGEVGLTHRGGVMVVPATESLGDWAAKAAAAQAALKQEVKK